MGDVPLASLSLTHVHYNPNDPISYLCAWLALIPQGLCVIYVTLMWATREAEIIMMFVGQMGCEVFNFLLKRLIKEKRPPQMLGKGYGMPSSHAQFLAFFSVSLTLFLLFRHNSPATHASYSHSDTPTPLLLRVTVSTLVLMVAGLVAASRVYLNYHTPKQVLVGCIAGVISALGWFVATEYVRRTGFLQWALEFQICRFFRLRDLVVEEDLVEAGWQEWKLRIKRRRKMSNEHYPKKGE